MGDLTREQIEAFRDRVQWNPEVINTVRALCTMALRALDAADEIATLRAALLARGIDAPAHYARTAAERDADAKSHVRPFSRAERVWQLFSMRAHHEAQKPRALDAGWQPMSTAPRDERILTLRTGKDEPRIGIVRVVDPNHPDMRAIFMGWMPLPPPCAEVPHE